MRLILPLTLLIVSTFVTKVAAPAQAPTGGTLRGAVSVVSAEGRVGSAQGVSLRLVGTGTSAAIFTTNTSDDGAYKIENIPPGDYTLTASAPLFQTATFKITIGAGQTSVKNIRLNLRVVRQQVEVHAALPLMSAQSVAPPARLTAKQVITAPVAEKKTQDELPLIPGVIRTPRGKTYIGGMAESMGMFEIDQAEEVDPVTGAFIIDLPVDAIQSLDVSEFPFPADNGGFVGGLTSVNTKAPDGEWRLKVNDIFPHILAEKGQLVGAKAFEPRAYLTGPLVAGKLNFSEAVMYDLNRDNVRGLPWPNNVTTTTGLDSFTTLQYLFSERHVLTGHLQFFPMRQANANIDALIPKPASENYGQRGYSITVTDIRTLTSGVTFTSMFHLLGLHNYVHAQGVQDMLVTPIGFGGDYFNDWNRSSDQEEDEETIGLPKKDWLGEHRLTFGVYFSRRLYSGSNVSRPIQILNASNAPVETIGFSGGSPLQASATEFDGYASDEWALGKRLSVNLGFRGATQEIGEDFTPAPRLGLVFTPDKEGKTILRAGVGVFYGRFPLLAADFASNPNRTVTMLGSTGLPLSAPVTYPNRCGQNVAGGIQLLSSCSQFDTTPFSTTWRVEVERRITSQIRARVGYLQNATSDVFVTDPTTLPGFGPAMLLKNTGSSQYHELEFAVVYAPNSRTHISATYVHSQSRGDLNTLSDLYGIYWEPIIRPNVVAALPSDVPDRFTTLSTIQLPSKFTFVPRFDVHSGFPYSTVDVFQNYAGTPNGSRFPTYFTFDFSLYREFHPPIFRRRRIRVGLFSINTTDRRNPTAVYNNQASPFFGAFTGPDKRIDGFIFDIR